MKNIFHINPTLEEEEASDSSFHEESLPTLQELLFEENYCTAAEARLEEIQAEILGMLPSQE
jgi:hypothetical protein